MEGYNAATGYGITSNEAWIDSFEETQLSILTGFQTMEDYQNSFSASVETMLNEVETAFANYNDNIQKAFEASGLSIEDFAKTLNKALNGEDGKGGAKNDLASFKTESSKLLTDTTANVKGALEEVGKYFDELGTKMKQATTDTWGLKDAIDEVKKKEKKKETEEPKNNNNNNKQPAGTSWDRIKTAYNKINTGAWGNGSARFNAGRADGYTDEELSLAQRLINMRYGGMSEAEAKKALGFNTGGYTGEWGSSGKIAILHEKELVLNKEDTENMLRAIEMVRAITQSIDLNNGMTLGWGGLSSIGVGNGRSDIVQEIIINADFPNATDQNEIKAAFDNLFIRASQYANRK